MNKNVLSTPNLSEDQVAELKGFGDDIFQFWMDVHNNAFATNSEGDKVDYRALNVALSSGFRALFKSQPQDERTNLAAFKLAVVRPILEITPRMGQHKTNWLKVFIKEAELLSEVKPVYNSLVNLLSEEE